MELIIVGILGYLISTLTDYGEIKKLKKENDDLRFENEELRLAVTKFE